MINSYLLMGAVLLLFLVTSGYLVLHSARIVNAKGQRVSASFANLIKCTHLRNDAIINFMGAARFANLTEEGHVSEMLDTRSKAILSEVDPENFIAVNSEATRAISAHLDGISHRGSRKFPEFSARLKELRQANLEVETAISDLSDAFDDYQTNLKKPINLLVDKLHRRRPPL